MKQEVVLAQQDYGRFQDLILERSGLYFPEEKWHSLRRHMAEALTSSPCASLDEYYTVLQENHCTHPEWERLISVLTVGETYFFRNKGHFDALVQRILPEVIARQEQSGRCIRIWSSGCATGEEPYSVAISLRELIPNLNDWQIMILATDINRAALHKAREGLYGEWSFRGVDERIRERYFRPVSDGQSAITDEVKRMVIFDHLNLVGDHYPSPATNTEMLDLILCRNVTIYFSPTMAREVVGRFYQCLKSEGWLIPGASEPNLLFYHDFQTRRFPGALVYQKPPAEAVSEAPETWSEPVADTSSIPTPVNIAPDARPLDRPDVADRRRSGIRCIPAGTAPAIDRRHPAGTDSGSATSAMPTEGIDNEADYDPDSAPACSMMGKIHANRGNLKKAQHWCQKAIKKDKLLPEPYYILSIIYQERGSLDKAIDALKKAIYLDRGFALAHYSLAQLYRKQGEAGLARRSLQLVCRLLEDTPSLEMVRAGDGLAAGQLLRLVEMELANGAQIPNVGR